MSDSPTPASRSLDPVFSPRSVAVVGASRNPASIGYSLLHNLVASGFAGTLFPVNPKAHSIHSLKCHPSLSEVPDPVDLAVVAVPRDLVQAIAEEAVEVGVRALVVITAGFSETGPEGAELERRLLETVRGAGLRMIGPNCMGVINADPEVSLNATFARTPARHGSIGFVSQSGALGVAILNVAEDLGLGLTQFVSMGNKADVSGNDLLEHWEHDPATRVIAMYLESFGNPRRFTEIAKRVGRAKPILVVKSGRTREGARAATSHTGALASGMDITVSAFLDQCGVLRADTIEELFDVARALDRCPLPPGDRVAIVTNAGGPGIMATDACIAQGLRLAELSEETMETLESFLPAEASVANPVDMIASAEAPAYRRALDVVLADEGVDMALGIHVTPLVADPYEVVEAVAGAAAEHAAAAPGEQDPGGSGSGKPVLSVVMATDEFYERVKHERSLPPVYRFPESAARAMAQLARYSEWRRTPAEPEPPRFDVDDAAVAALLDEHLERQGDGYLPPEAAFRVLELYGLPVAHARTLPASAGPEEAARVASELGWPVVVKGIAPELVHKSDVGAVVTGVEDAEELSEAIRSIREGTREAGHEVEGYLVQETGRGDREVIFGISTDPRFGPVLMFGLGGRYVEVLRDVRFGVTPLSAAEADEMVRGIRGFPILEGTRGEEGVDLDLLVEVLLRLGQLAERHPRIRELDVNPFLAAPPGGGSAAVDARVRVEAEGDGE